MGKIIRLILIVALLVVIIMNFRVSTLKNTVSDKFGTNAGQGLLYFENTRDLTDILKSKKNYSDEWIKNQIKMQNKAFDTLKNNVSCEIPNIKINKSNVDKLLELNTKIVDLIVSENDKLEIERNKLKLYKKKLTIIHFILLVLLLILIAYKRFQKN